MALGANGGKSNAKNFFAVAWLAWCSAAVQRIIGGPHARYFRMCLKE